MQNSQQISQRFEEVMLNGRWIANTNFKHILEDVSWEQATQKVGTLNTIAALTFHVNYYIAGVLNVLEGGKLEIRDKYSFDLPEITSEEAWTKLKHTLSTNAEKFAQKLKEIPDKKLESTFVDEKYGTYYRNLEGMIEHAYYHLGQIALIKKLIQD